MNKTQLQRALYAWYEQNRRTLPWRDSADPYAIWISEIILQQTRVVQGIDYYLRFISRFPDVETLAAAGEDEVLRYWQGLGYYSRARNLHKAAQMIVREQWLPFPTKFEQIRQLPGVGDYTVGAIAAFAYNLPYPAMDGNVYRVVARLFDCEIPFDTTAGKKHFHKLIEELLDKENPRLFDAAIMEFGALFCVPTLQHTDTDEKACTYCPLQVHCIAYQHNTAELLPVRKPRPQLRDRYLNYYIYIAHDKTLIRQRTEKDIWQHLYEFPLREADQLFVPERGQWHKDFTHILSHQRLHARFFYIPVETLPTITDTFPVTLAELDDYALSRLTLKAIEELENIMKKSIKE